MIFNWNRITRPPPSELIVFAFKNKPAVDVLTDAGMKLEPVGLPGGENGLTLPCPYCGWLKTL